MAMVNTNFTAIIIPPLSVPVEIAKLDSFRK